MVQRPDMLGGSAPHAQGSRWAPGHLHAQGSVILVIYGPSRNQNEAGELEQEK